MVSIVVTDDWLDQRRTGLFSSMIDGDDLVLRYCSNDDHDDCTGEGTLVRVGLPVFRW